MPLLAREVKAGTIAYLDYLLLREHEGVDHGGTSINRDGPFLCVQVIGDNSCWIPLTSQHREERLKLKPEWRKGGSPKFRAEALYVNDGLNTFVGPIAAFVEAGKDEHRFIRFQRPSVTPDGVAAVLVEIARQGGSLCPTE